jgi:Carboxypeptidase regulatory-like domain
MYTDQRQCPQPDLHVKKLEGHVSDSNGGPVRGAGEIVLLDAAGSLAANVGIDRDGNFSFPGPLEGTFELRIERGGFNPAHTPLHIESTADGSSLEIETV